MKKTELFTKRNTIIGGAVLALVLVILLVVSLVKAFTKPVIAFYGIDSSSQTAITACIEDYLKQNHIGAVIKTLEATQKLEPQISFGRKPALLITTSGEPTKLAANHASSSAALSPELLTEMTSSIRSTAIYNKSRTKVHSVPLLSDNMEIDIDISAFRSSKMKSISTWQDIENFSRLQKKTMDYPVIFAGKDPSFILDLFGALTEALDGQASYKKAAELIKKNAEKKWNASYLAEQLSGDYNAPLYSARSLLTKWYEEKLLNPDSFNLSTADVNAFLKARLAVTSFMTLTAHRQVAQKTIERFSSIYLPSDNAPSSRCFTANVISAVPERKNKSLQKLVQYLVSQEVQEKLSRSTGLAPVLSHCRTPDHQADDARYWIAATNAPFPGLSREADLSQEQKIQLSSELLARIRYNNK